MLVTAALLASIQRPDPEIESIIRKMTQAEKITMIGGSGFGIKANKRLGIAGIEYTDGPLGVRNFGPSTSYPAGITLAQTWNTQLAHEFGVSMARDAKARGVQIILGPGVNLHRIPQNGRNFEYLGEDPKLCADLAVGQIKGMQENGVGACIKHFAANEHENDRNMDSSEVDERTLRELYFRPFEEAVKQANVASVMCSYNKLNGTYTSAHKWLLTDVLRKDWGFKGFVMTDWGAAHETVGMFNSGMDIEMPEADFFKPERVAPLLENGTLSKAELDRKVRAMLTVMKRYGWLHERPQATGPRDSDLSHQTALKVAREGTVLLKNDGTLPVSPQVKNILVLGDNADPVVTNGGGSSFVTPARSISLLQAVRNEFRGQATVNFVDTSRRLKTAFSVTKWDPAGYAVEVFKNMELKGEPVYKGRVKSLDNDWDQLGIAPNTPTDFFSARFTGKFTAPTTDRYYLVHSSDDGLRVWLDGKLVVDDWKDQGATVKSVELDLEGGHAYDVKMEFYDKMGAAVARIGFLPFDLVADHGELERALSKADLVVMATGFDSTIEGEGYDRTYTLPATQQALLDRVLKAGKHPVVVHFGGGAADYHRWLPSFSGFLFAGYPGGIGAQAIAEILRGKVNPSGKLACTFPAAYTDHYAGEHYPVKDNKLPYSEGLLMGYRWFDAKGLSPDFAFGEGLSYTQFGYSGLKVGRKSVSFRVTNLGKRAGSEVAQLYVSRPGGPEKQALHGYAKVRLAPGQSKMVNLPLEPKWMSRWDVGKHGWVLDRGEYTVAVGRSSRDLPLTAKFRR